MSKLKLILKLFVITVICLVLFTSCASIGGKKLNLTAQDKDFIAKYETKEEKIPALEIKLSELKCKPLYEFSPKEIDLYLRYLYSTEPDVRKRIVHLARKNLGQPYKIYLLGEYPYEIYDDAPLYDTSRGDCVVHTEHMYAMGFAHDWPSFFSLLQRIRYKDGEISVLTRNHWTIASWDQNNSWLVKDIAEELAGDKAVEMSAGTGYKWFFKKFKNLEVPSDMKDYKVKAKYIPLEEIGNVIDKLKPGDFVNVIRGYDGAGWCGHVGMITVSDDGTVNFLHSTPPKSKEQPVMEYVKSALASNKRKIDWNKLVEEEKKNPPAKKKWWQFWKKQPKEKKKRKALMYGLNFYRLQENALENLKKIDGEDAPLVTGPKGLLNKFPK